MLRSAVALLPVVIFASPAGAESVEVSDGARLADYFGTKKGYRAVKRDVLAWHKTTRNGCVAFASTALRHIGIAVPIDEKRDGWGVSRITFTFSDYLTGDLSWQRIEDPAALLPGDLVFTAGAPDHVFVFHSYKSKRRLIARAIDNQGRQTGRQLQPRAGSTTAAFAYALRAPPGD